MSYTLVTTAKNEGPYFLEWVAYHRWVGFENILVYQNDSNDLTDEILKELDRIGAINYYYNRAGHGRHQVRAYKRASRKAAYTQADWAMALDMDEFLFIRTGDGKLDDLMQALPPTDEVLLNWRRFGHSGKRNLRGGLVTQRFQIAEHQDRVTTHLTPFKALFRPQMFERCGIHQPYPLPEPPESIRVCNGSGLPKDEFDWYRFRCKDPGKRALAQINHYITRDAASFVLKSDRGSAHQADRGIDKTYWRRRNFNDQRDDGLSRRAPIIKAAMAVLDAQSGGKLGELRLKSLEMHQARFKALMKEPQYRDLYEFCASDAQAA